MCLTVPARVVRVEGAMAWIDDNSVERQISLAVIGAINPGDYVLHHAGLALKRIEPDEAQEILALLQEIELASQN
jgi:hydrogenase expression/formation protein HypC